MNAQQRRELLEGLIAKLREWDDTLYVLQGVDLSSSLSHDCWMMRSLVITLRAMIDGALLGPLDNDAAWCELLTMLAQEVADGNQSDV